MCSVAGKESVMRVSKSNPLRVWRRFKLGNTPGTLKPRHQSGRLYEEGVDYQSEYLGSVRAPSKQHVCGFYAYKDQNKLDEHFYEAKGTTVVRRVAMWGKVVRVQGDDGAVSYRAQYMRIPKSRKASQVKEVSA